MKQHSLHDDKGAYENLVKGFRDDEKEEFVKILRLEPEQFNFILAQITPLIARKDTTFPVCHNFVASDKTGGGEIGESACCIVIGVSSNILFITFIHILS